MKEIWKDIKNYEGLYKVSNFGNVKRTKLLKFGKDRKGYCFVNLSKNGKIKCCRVHRLVAEVFIPNPLKKEEINHIDGNKTNNCVSNLEWSTHKENMKHANSHNLFSTEGRKRAVLSMNKATQKKIGQYKNGVLIRVFESISQAKRITNTHHIGDVAKGLRQKANGYEWKYI